MDSLSVNLTAALIDNQVTQIASTKVEINLNNSTGRINIKDIEGGPRSVHSFTANDASDFGCGGVYNLNPEQAGYILATGCSLINPKVLFSPVQPYQLSATLKFGDTPSKVEVVDTLNEKHIILTETIRVKDSVSILLTTKLNLDEREILDVSSRLLKAKIFDLNGRNLNEINIIEAIKSYHEASLSNERLSCYKSLYNAFEKAINSDTTDRKGESFDTEASSITGEPQCDIKNIRLLDNRVKHAIRNHNDLNLLQSSEANFAQMIRTLKTLADRAILNRLPM